MAREPMHKKLYKDSPEMERDGESGKMAVKKKGPTDAEKESSEVNAGIDGIKINTEGLPASARHSSERRDMHGRHETEHSMIDNGKGGEKKEMHDRHQRELKDMHKRHEKEYASTGSGDGKEKIKKVTKGE